MTLDEISGRLVAVEVIAVAALGLCLANTRNDPDGAKTDGLLQSLQNTVEAMAVGLSPDVQYHARAQARLLLAQARQSVQGLGGQPALLK